MILTMMFLVAFQQEGAAYNTPDFEIQAAQVQLHENLNLLVFSQKVAGQAGRTTPQKNGSLDGAPVLAYVFPTTLQAKDVGFTASEGIVALAVTSHPDFDDTPLWDENNNGNYLDDGQSWHTHWVLLGKDERVPGGLAVRQIRKEEMAKVLPPTHPGMPMFMDSPGFAVHHQEQTLKVLVPLQRVSGKREFQFDAVTAYMRVSTDPKQAMLGVYQVYKVLSGDLSLPYQVKLVP